MKTVWTVDGSPVVAGKRRIRVHTLCLPVVNQLSDVYAGADVQAITCLLANMGQSAFTCRPHPLRFGLNRRAGLSRGWFNVGLSLPTVERKYL